MKYSCLHGTAGSAQQAEARRCKRPQVYAPRANNAFIVFTVSGARISIAKFGLRRRTVLKRWRGSAHVSVWQLEVPRAHVAPGRLRRSCKNDKGASDNACDRIYRRTPASQPRSNMQPCRVGRIPVSVAYGWHLPEIRAGAYVQGLRTIKQARKHSVDRRAKTETFMRGKRY